MNVQIIGENRCFYKPLCRGTELFVMPNLSSYPSIAEAQLARLCVLVSHTLR